MAGEEDSPATYSLCVGIFSTAILTLIVPFYWSQLTASQWGLLILLVALGLEYTSAENTGRFIEGIQHILVSSIWLHLY